MKNKLLVLAFLIPAIALASWVLVLSHERSSWDEVKVVKDMIQEVCCRDTIYNMKSIGKKLT